MFSSYFSFQSKRDELLVDVKFYFRASEVPENAYQLLVQDRRADKGKNQMLLSHF